LHLTTSPIDWYAARAAGVAAYVLLSTVVLLGLTMAGRKRLARWPRFAIEDVHRIGGLLVGTFISIHVLTIAIDGWLPFSLQSLAVPLLSYYRPIWVALGIVAAELLLALAVTNHYRNRSLRYATWRRAHYLNFAVWGSATLHGLGSGTDRSSVWLLAIYVVATASVTAAIGWRFLRPRPFAIGAAGAATGAAVVGLAAGPLHVQPRLWNAGNFSGPLAGSVQGRGGSVVAVMLTGVGGGRQHVWLRADVLVRKHRSILGSSFKLEYLPSGVRCTGRLTHVEAYSFVAHCRTRTGLRRAIEVRWKSGPTAQLVGGHITSRDETPVTADP
jgi:methionine sulfoxide reductase heme-binding subunit